MQSKWLLFSITLTSLALSALPEFISEEMKTKAENIFGTHYDAAWFTIFLLLGALFTYLTMRQFKTERGNLSQAPTSASNIVEKKGSSIVIEDLETQKDIVVKNETGVESSASFKKMKSEKGGIKIDNIQK